MRRACAQSKCDRACLSGRFHCGRHACAVENCVNGVQFGSWCCSMHECKSFGCKGMRNKKTKGSSFCVTHECLNCPGRVHAKHLCKICHLRSGRKPWWKFW